MCIGNTKDKHVYSSFHKIKDTDSKIVWNQHQKLKWSDFQALPDTLSTYRAMTYVQVGLKYEEYQNYIAFDIPTYFYKNLSWTKSNKNDLLLRHEQLHFDMAELMARKIRKAFEEFEINNPNSIYEDLKQIYKKYYGTELDSYNAQYDKQTDHGTIESKQIEWELKIRNELNSLKMFSEVRIEMDRK